MRRIESSEGICRYCRRPLLDKANIRCDSCDRAFQDGSDLGKEEIKDEIRRAIRFFMNLVKER